VARLGVVVFFQKFKHIHVVPTPIFPDVPARHAHVAKPDQTLNANQPLIALHETVDQFPHPKRMEAIVKDVGAGEVGGEAPTAVTIGEIKSRRAARVATVGVRI